MRSTIVKPTNGKTNKNRSRSQSKNKSSGWGLRRLSKRQKEKIYKIFTIIFLIAFGFTIVGALIATTVKVPGQ